MTYETKDAVLDIYEDFGIDDDHSPFDFREDDIEEEWLEEGDAIILPGTSEPLDAAVPNKIGVFTPERAGSVHEAVKKLVATNPARREVLLAIIDLSREGALASRIDEKVAELHSDNQTVYAPVSLCRMLERAGALEFEMPELGEECEDVEEGVGYLKIDEQVDPIWRATPEGITAYEELTQGNEWREVVFDTDATYAEVYLAVMKRIKEEPCGREAINELAKTFEITQSPRRFGTHFIDLLEKTSAIKWTNHAWTLTELGEALLPELAEYCEGKSQTDAEMKRGA